jgi:hypothetical protein
MKETKDTTAVASESTIPAGYLSVEEIAAQYPDFAKRAMSAHKFIEGVIPNEPTLKVMVYINEPIPLKARILSTDTIEMLKNKEPFSMLAMDALNLVGDPTYRFDLTEVPKALNIISDNWGAIKRQTLEYTFRVSQHAGRGKKMARYVDTGYTAQLEKLHLLDRIPDIRFLVDAQIVENFTPQLSIEAKIWEIMQLHGIQANKEKYSDAEVAKVSASLEEYATTFGMDFLKGKNSHAHIRYFIDDANKKFAPLPV